MYKFKIYFLVSLVVVWQLGQGVKRRGGWGDGPVRKDRTNLEISEADDAPEIFEDRNLRYGCRVETRDALSMYGSPLDHHRITITRAPRKTPKAKTKQKMNTQPY